MMDNGYPAVAFAVGDELEKALARIRELEGDNANLRDLAYNRAPKIAAEECNKQKAEFEAQLAEARQERDAFRDAINRTNSNILAAVVRGTVRRAEKAEADAATLRELLREIEWEGEHYDGHSYH